MTTQPLSALTMLLSRHTRRREFITLLAGTALAWPFAARAQQPGKLPTMGFLGTVTHDAWSPYAERRAPSLAGEHTWIWISGLLKSVDPIKCSISPNEHCRPGEELIALSLLAGLGFGLALARDANGSSRPDKNMCSMEDYAKIEAFGAGHGGLGKPVN
jgi:hypothetical protein